MRIYSVGLMGVSPFLIELESAAAQGLPLITLLGLPETHAKAMRERVSTALESAKIKITHKRLTLNFLCQQPFELRLSRIPLDLLDLPLALLMLCESSPEYRQRLFPTQETERVLAIGQLSLAGELRPLAFWAPLAKILAEDAQGFTQVFTPRIESAFYSTEPEVFQPNLIPQKTFMHFCGKHIKDFLQRHKEDSALGVNSLQALQKHDSSLQSQTCASTCATTDPLALLHEKPFEQLVALCAQTSALHCLFAGPPGVGKTFLANLIAENQTPLSQAEAASLALVQGEDLPLKRPVRKPHHSATGQSFTGGAKLNLGELGLAHTGVLFLDEIAEFPQATLEVLREPLDDGKVRLSRALGQFTYPAKFQLLATMNPCPCGYHLHESIPCRCPPTKVKKYLGKLGGPLLDRIHIQVWLEPTHLKNSGANEVAKELLRSRQKHNEQNGAFKTKRPLRDTAHHRGHVVGHCKQSASLREQKVETELLACLERIFPEAHAELRQAAAAHLRSFRGLLIESAPLY